MADSKNDALTGDSTILIVDDNPDYAALLKRFLEGALGFRKVEVVHSLDKAYQQIEQDPTCAKLLFVDYNFPGGQRGSELLKKLHETNLMHGKAAFVITSEPTIENQREAQALGAIGVVAKPFDRENLRQQIEKAKRFLIAQDTEGF